MWLRLHTLRKIYPSSLKSRRCSGLEGVEASRVNPAEMELQNVFTFQVVRIERGLTSCPFTSVSSTSDSQLRGYGRIADVSRT
jgi:hypothetical protein